MRIALRHWIISFIFVLASLGQGQGMGSDNRINPESAKKDSKNEIIEMKLSDSKGEEFTAVFESDKNERMLPSVLRQYLNDQELQMKQMAEFIRAYLSLPENFYRENLGGQVELHYLIRELADDYFVIDYFHRLQPDLKNKIMKAYFVKYPDTQVEFFRRFMNHPVGTSSEKIRADFSRLPKTYQEEINRLYQWDQKNWRGRFKESFARPLSGGMHGFPAQSALFGVAIGAVMVTKMMTDYSENPAAFLQYIESLDDPMTHISFYSFMAASGFTQDYLKTKFGGMNGSKSIRTMRAAIPYIGLSAGLIVSNLTHEISSLLAACSDSLLKPNKPVQPGKVDPCDEAQNEFFNFENKVEMYIPMILSMTLSTVGSTYAQKGLMAGAGASYNYAKNLSEQMAGIHKASGLPHVEIVQDRIGFNGQKTQWYKTVQAKDMVKIAKNIPGTSKRFLGIAMNIALTGRGWSLGPVTVATTLTAMLAQNYFFILGDTYIMPAISKVMAQVLRASFLNSTDKQMKESLVYHQTVGWKELAKKCEVSKRSRGSSTLAKSDCEYNMVEDIKKFQKHMNIWRTQNHAKFFNGVQIWGQITNTLLSEIYEAQKFYQFYVNEVFQGFKFQNKLNENKEIKKVEEPFNTQLSNRMNPLFGIKPLGHPECEQGSTGQVCVTELQLYMNFPVQMEGFQKNRVQYVVNTFAKRFGLQEKAPSYQPKAKKTGIAVLDEDEEASLNLPMKETSPAVDEILKLSLQEKSSKLIQALLTHLATLDTDKISQAIIRLNKELANDVDPDFNKQKVLGKIRELLGQPNPLLARGALLPFIYHESRKNAASYSQVSRKAYGYYFKRHTEYLLFQMVCGPDLATHSIVEEWNVNLFGRETNLRPPQFNAPRIVNLNKIEVRWPDHIVVNGPKRTNFCVPVVGEPIAFDSIYYAQFFVNGSEKSYSFFEMLNRYIKPEILGPWNSQRLDSKTNVSKWWDQNIESTMMKIFERLDYNFQYLLVDLVEGLQPDGKNLVKTTKASRSLLDSSLEEINVYLMILSEIEKSTKGYTWVKELNLKHSRSLVESLKFNPEARVPSQTAIVQVINQLSSELRKIDIQMTGDHPRLNLGIDAKKLPDMKKNIDESLKNYQSHLKESGTLDQYSADVQKASFDALEMSVNSLMMYLQNTQMAKYDATEAVESRSSEANKKGQNKATVKSSSIPMGQ